MIQFVFQQDVKLNTLTPMMLLGLRLVTHHLILLLIKTCKTQRSLTNRLKKPLVKNGVFFRLLTKFTLKLNPRPQLNPSNPKKLLLRLKLSQKLKLPPKPKLRLNKRLRLKLLLKLRLNPRLK